MEVLLRDLHSRKVDPTRHADTVLGVVKVDGTYYSNDNRRLNVLREYMHDLGRELYVQCRVFEWHRAYGRWLKRYTERTGVGLEDSDGIKLRNKPRRGAGSSTSPAFETTLCGNAEEKDT